MTIYKKILACVERYFQQTGAVYDPVVPPNCKNKNKQIKDPLTYCEKEIQPFAKHLGWTYRAINIYTAI